MTKRELLEALASMPDDTLLSIRTDAGHHLEVKGLVLSRAVPKLRIDEAYLMLGQDRIIR